MLIRRQQTKEFSGFQKNIPMTHRFKNVNLVVGLSEYVTSKQFIFVILKFVFKGEEIKNQYVLFQRLGLIPI